MAAILEATEVNLGPVAQIPPGEGRNFRAGALGVAVFRTHQGEIYATQPRCPHRQGPLADGLVGGRTLICPLHELAFDLATGEALGGSPCKITTYPVRVSEGCMVLTLPRE